MVGFPSIYASVFSQLLRYSNFKRTREAKLMQGIRGAAHDIGILLSLMFFESLCHAPPPRPCTRHSTGYRFCPKCSVNVFFVPHMFLQLYSPKRVTKKSLESCKLLEVSSLYVHYGNLCFVMFYVVEIVFQFVIHL